jgi:hypothetical protein
MFILLLQFNSNSTFFTLCKEVTFFAFIQQMMNKLSNINISTTSLTVSYDLTIIHIMISLIFYQKFFQAIVAFFELIFFIIFIDL